MYMLCELNVFIYPYRGYNFTYICVVILHAFEVIFNMVPEVV